MTDLYSMDQGKLSITLHPGQTKAWDSARRFVFVIAGTQSGKTSFVPVWLDREIQRGGRGDYLGVTATYDLFKLKFLPELQHYFKDLFGWGYSASERVLWRQDKPRLFTRIILRSADAEGGLESATAKAAVLDECGQDKFRVTAWEAVQRRLSLSQGRVLAATTPYNLGWLKTMIFDVWQKGDPDIHVIQFKSIMNPAFPREEYDRMKRKLPDWKFQMFYNGEFSRPAGLIYGDFTQAHIIPPFEVPIRFPRYLGVDFGGVHLAKLYIAEDPANGYMYVYREALSGDKTTKEHVREVLDHKETPALGAGASVLTAFGGSGSEDQQRRDWSDAGLHVQEPAIDDVEAGIDKVIEALKTRRLYVFSTCTGLIDEFGTYARELDDFGEPTEKIKDKNEFHRLDALRYVVPSVMEQEQAGVVSYNYAR
jgi:hypothetical protein